MFYLIWMYVQEWLQRTISKVDALLMEVCRKFDVEKYKIVSSEVNFCICVCVSGMYNMAIYQTLQTRSGACDL